MLYYFLANHINLFRYLTFRGIGAFLTAFLIGVIFGAPIIEKLRVLKFGQVVRDDGPETHKAKTGTPTMGGFFLWGAAIVSSLLWASLNIFVIIALLSVVLYGAIGFVDDYKKIKKANTDGLSSWRKLFWQAAAALVLLLMMMYSPSYNTTINRVDLAVRDAKHKVVNHTNVALNRDFSWSTVIDSIDEPDTYSFSLGVYAAEAGAIRYTNAFNFPAYLTDNGGLQNLSGEITADNGSALTIHLTRSELGMGGNVVRSEKTNFIVPYRSKLFQAQFIPYYAKVLWYV
ncbi:MAG: hypothetical protein ACRCY4_02180, partial [Brevinema sp.]